MTKTFDMSIKKLETMLIKQEQEKRMRDFCHLESIIPFDKNFEGSKTSSKISQFSLGGSFYQFDKIEFNENAHNFNDNVLV
jgi:hypothetical protein